MIYDIRIDLYRLPTGIGTINQAASLDAVSWGYCAELEVYASSYYRSVMAGSLIDRMVELPGLSPVTAGDFAEFKGSLYRIDRIQHSRDENGLPVYRLTLQKEDAHYDYAKPQASS